MGAASALEVICATHDASTLLRPMRLQVLEALAEGDSATGVARKLGLARQKVNYHVRKLEQAGLVEQVGERRRRGCMERLVRATATSYVIAPSVLGRLGSDPSKIRDRFSTDYLIALAGRTIRELAETRTRADAEGKKVATLGIDTELRFGSPVARKRFTEELATAVATLVARYHDDQAPDGRSFRLQLHSYPRPDHQDAQGDSDDEKREDP